uniref:5'(3')-deoxyribonucleotidase, mitochondrial-like n=1 Tax=Saccoglossus kowalevskii TaxID=10224 RepID=A0ABM0MYG5_SACKO|nr:PREDICTED: 5'(3')-deoxyribonucleotidase, mitochondrial-like [Saccoglossus kowalevskii]
MSTNLRILVDMDGVLADFEGHFLKRYQEKYPREPYINVADRHGFYLNEQYAKIKPELKDLVFSVYEEAGFFLDLPPIAGALETVKELDNMNDIDVFICTSPVQKYTHCVTEKFQWIDKYLGNDFVTRMVLTRDKTVVSGDLLIDDKPNITGAEKNPSWEHILFTTPPNSRIQSNPSPRRLNGWHDRDSLNRIIESKRKEKFVKIIECQN